MLAGVGVAPIAFMQVHGQASSLFSWQGMICITVGGGDCIACEEGRAEFLKDDRPPIVSDTAIRSFIIGQKKSKFH